MISAVFEPKRRFRIESGVRLDTLTIPELEQSKAADRMA
jgi:hypothetical protein